LKNSVKMARKNHLTQHAGKRRHEHEEALVEKPTSKPAAETRKYLPEKSFREAYRLRCLRRWVASNPPPPRPIAAEKSALPWRESRMPHLLEIARHENIRSRRSRNVIAGHAGAVQHIGWESAARRDNPPFSAWILMACSRGGFGHEGSTRFPVKMPGGTVHVKTPSANAREISSARSDSPSAEGQPGMAA